MKARTTFLAVTGVLFISLIVGFYFGGRRLLVEAFAHKEREACKQLVPLLKRAVQLELEKLDQIAGLQGDNQEIDAWLAIQPQYAFLEATANRLASQKNHLLAILDHEAKPQSAFRFDPYTSRLSSELESLTEACGTNGVLGAVMTDDTGDGLRGILPLGDDLFMVALRAVPGAPKGQPPRLLLVGRSLAYEETTRRLAAVLPANSSDRVLVRRSTAEGARHALHDSIVSLLPSLDSWRITLWLRDLAGRPVAEMSVTVAAPFTMLARDVFQYILLMLLGSGFITLLAIWFAEDLNVFRPLSRLAEQVRAIRRGETEKRIGWERHDELGEVAQELDRLLSLLETEHRAVIESEKHNRALVEANPDALLVIDSGGVILDAKAEHDADLGAPVSMLVCHGLEALGLDTAERGRFEERLSRVLGTGRMQVMEFRRQQTDGTTFWGEARMVRLDPHRMLAIIRNITERKRAEDERERFDDRVSQIQKFESLGVLASGIAHDFNNILAAIVGHAEQVQQTVSDAAPQHESLDQIVRAAMRASALTRQMLNYAGQGACNFQPINLNTMLSEMLQLLRMSLSKQARFDVSMARDLPLVHGDSAQLWQVAMNLLTNASDALGGHPGTIRMTTRGLHVESSQLAEFLGTPGMKPGLYAMFEVADSGCGMSEETLMRIFDPFFSTRAAGRGLGLSAVLGILKAHGGGICVHSQPDKGSTFKVILPAVDAPETPAAESASWAAALAPDARKWDTTAPFVAPASEKRLALIADDQPDICRLLSLMVRSAGWDVVNAVNGRQAMALFQQHRDRVQLVFLDEEMPELSGHAVLEIIRRLHPNLPAVVISGHGTAACEQRFADLRPTAILAKPFRRDEIIQVLNQVDASPAEKE